MTPNVDHNFLDFLRFLRQTIKGIFMPPNLSYCSLTFLSLFRNPNYSSLNRWRCLKLCQGNWSPKMVIFNIFIKILYKRYTKFPYVGNSKWVWIFKLWKGVINKPHGQNFGHFWPTSPLCGHFYYLNKAYIIKWSFA